jgi:hypothetical protein
LLTDRSGSRRKTPTSFNNLTENKSLNSIKNNSKLKASSSKIEENRKRIEAQLEKASQNSTKPTPNAQPMGFQSTASRLAASQAAKSNNSFSEISDIEIENHNQRPKR